MYASSYNKKMELQSFINCKASESGSEVYHEISAETTFNLSLPSNTLDKPINENDFFIQLNNTKDYKTISKKKKTKKKYKSQNFLSTLSAELASKPLLLENVISLRDNRNEKYSYLQESYRRRDVIKTKGFDAEEGHFGDENVINISPIFPSILENSSRKDTSLSLKYTKPVMFSDIVTMSHGSELSQGPRFLDINIHTLRILHHQSFTLEILLGIKLETLYKNYQTNKKRLSDLERAVKVNRKTRNNLREHLNQISPNKKDELRFDETILKYTKIMLEFKEKYYITIKEVKKLSHQILSLWSDIETVRSKSACITAPCSLEVTKRELSEDEYKEAWMRIFEDEYSDLLIKVENDYIVEYLHYKELKRNDKEKKGVVKPILKFDDEGIKEAAHSIVCDRMFQQNLSINLRKNEKYFKNILHPNFKQQYLFKVYVDNVFVCESEKYFDTKNTYVIDFTETISIQLLKNNKSLKITLFENDDKISSLRININEITENIAQAVYTQQNFVCVKAIAPTSKSIGSGYDIKNIATANNVRLKSSNLFKGNLFTVYEAGIKVGWHENTSSCGEQIKSLVNLRTSLKRLFLGTLKPTVDLLTEVITSVYDKSIIKDSQILNAVKEVCNEKVRNDFREFALDECAQNSARFELLHLRNVGKFNDLKIRSIPLLDNQISTEQLNALTSTDDIHIKNLNFDDKDEMNPIDLQRYLGVKYVMKLNKNLMAKIDDFLLQKTYKDVVNDFEHLSIRGFLNKKPNINLGATSTLAKQQLLRDCFNEEQEIRITVMRAHNLLNRVHATEDEQSLNDDIAGYKMHPLRPFLRVSYHGETYLTPTAVGCHPTWNHTVVIKSKLEPLACISINFYDECRTRVLDSASDQAYHYRRYTIFLGSVQIPLRAVLDAGTLRGAFKIMTPPFMFGYEVCNEPKSTTDIMQLLKTDKALIFLNITTSLSHLAAQSYNQPLCNNDKDDLIIKHLNAFTTDYLYNFPSRNLSLTFIDSSGSNKSITEFLQPIPLPEDDYFPRDPKKVESSVSKGSGQSRSSSSKSSRRKLTDEDLSPLNRDVDNWTKSENQTKINEMDAAIRYVSLIPAYEVLDTHAVTLMGVELLKVQYGSFLDHTILLASFFIYLGIKCYVITGWGLPRGLSSYVLVKFHHQRVVIANEDLKKGFWVKNDGTAWYVYDAASGERFDLREIGCPLKTVSYVFDCENIWVNMQASQDCGSVSMDLTKASDWQTVFNKPLFLTKPIETLYSPPHDVEGLRATLEMKIKTKIQKWRPHAKTVWNRYCSGLLREALPHWEYWAFNTSRSRPNPSHRLKQLVVTYKMSGLPVNMPYVNSKLITSRIKNTALHVDEDPDVEFGLAVEVFAYPNNVLSVWVYLVSIVKIID